MRSGSLRASWHLWVPTGYTGAAPQGWVGFDLSVVGPTGINILDRVLKGAEPIRPGAAPAAGVAKAAQAQENGVYTWYFDTHARALERAASGVGGSGGRRHRTKVRNGCARGVAATIVQLIDCSLAAVASEQGCGGNDLRLPGGRTGWAGRGDLPVCGLAWWTESGTEQTFPLAENSVNVNARLVGRSRSFPPACLWSSQ